MSSHKNQCSSWPLTIGDSSQQVYHHDVPNDTTRNGIPQNRRNHYRYQVVPFDSSQRILVVELGHTSIPVRVTADLWVNQKGKQEYARSTPNHGLNNRSIPLCDGTIHLSALSLLSWVPTPRIICWYRSEAKLDDPNSKPTSIWVRRLNALGTRKWWYTRPNENLQAKDNVVYGDITDKSTTNKVDEADKQLPELAGPLKQVLLLMVRPMVKRLSKLKWVQEFGSSMRIDAITAIENVGKASAVSA